MSALNDFTKTGNPETLTGKQAGAVNGATTYQPLAGVMDKIGLGKKSSSSPLGILDGKIFGGFNLPIPGISSSSSAESGIYGSPVSVNPKSGSKSFGGKQFDFVTALGIVGAVIITAFALKRI